jgi:hypothetical protein
MNVYQCMWDVRKSQQLSAPVRWRLESLMSTQCGPAVERVFGSIRDPREWLGVTIYLNEILMFHLAVLAHDCQRPTDKAIIADMLREQEAYDRSLHARLTAMESLRPAPMPAAWASALVGKLRELVSTGRTLLRRGSSHNQERALSVEGER